MLEQTHKPAEYVLPAEAFLRKNVKKPNATKEMANVEIRKIAEDAVIEYMDLMIVAVETDLWHELVYALDSSNDDNVEIIREQLVLQAEKIKIGTSEILNSECNFPDCGCPHFMC